MNEFRQHIPGFMDIGEPFSFEFETVEELLSQEWINNFSYYDDFYRYSLVDNCLMFESHKGKHWWVLGYINNPKLIDLPKWEPVT